jgi:hypothetical protein
MAASDTDADKRRHPRVNVAKTARAKSGDDEREGVVRDISAGGAALEIEADWEDGAYAEIDIDDLTSLSGHVTRTFDDGFAIEFDLDEEEEDRLLSEVMEMHTNTSLEEE